MIVNLILLCGLLYFLWQQLIGRRARYPDGPFPYPLIGNIPQVGVDFAKIGDNLHEMGKQYGGLFTVWLPDPQVVITDYDLLKEALITNGEAFAGRPYQHLFVRTNGGRYGLVFTDGPVWRDQRRFSLHVLRDFGFGRNVMEQKVNFEVDRLIEEIDRVVDSGDEAYSAQNVVMATVASIIGMILFGQRYDLRDDAVLKGLRDINDEFIDIFNKPISQLLILFPFLQHVPLFDNFNDKKLLELVPRFQNVFVDQIEKHKIELKDVGDQEPSDFTHAYLLEMEKLKKKGVNLEEAGYSDWQLAMCISDLFGAGSDTTQTTIEWGLLVMAIQQDTQERVHQEIISVLGDSRITMADKPRLPFLNCCVVELQRLADILQVNLQHETTQDVTVAGKFIPKGTTVIPQLHSALRDELVFPDGTSYRPTRFLVDPNGTQLNQSLMERVIPFGLGKRQCLGESLARMELLLIFTTLLQKFKFELSDEDKLKSMAELMTPVSKFATKTPEYKFVGYSRMLLLL